MRRVILLMALVYIGMSFSLFVNSYAISDKKEEYELQERCANRAEEYFMKEFGNGTWTYGSVTFSARFTDHYNKTMNKCFILITLEGIGDTFVSEFKDLKDVNEMKEYGSFTKCNNRIQPNACEVSGKYCKSEAEWDSFVKPYMEE
jgi:hypothetical protein